MVDHHAIARKIVNQIVEDNTWTDFNKLTKYCSTDDLDKIHQELVKVSERLNVILNKIERKMLYLQ